MKVMAWEEFRQLPQGAVFQEFSECAGTLQELEIFGGVCDDGESYVSAPLMPWTRDLSSMSPDELEALGLRRDDPVSAVCTPNGFGRTTYDLDKRRWLVWEDKDRARVAMWLVDPVQALDDMNGNPLGHVLYRGGGIVNGKPRLVQQVSLGELTKDRA